jgi:hypothetical protein
MTDVIFVVGMLAVAANMAVAAICLLLYCFFYPHSAELLKIIARRHVK